MELPTQEQILSLTPPQRLELISQLWDSLEERDIPLTAAQEVELDRRLAMIERGEGESYTWDEVKARLGW